MKKFLIIFIIGIFLITPYISAQEHSSTIENIELKIKYGLGITMIIENIGEESIKYIQWNFSIKGGHLNLTNKTFNGIIETFDPGEKIVKRIFVFGFGFIEVDGMVCWPVLPPGSVMTCLLYFPKNSFLFGPFIYPRP
jgi:hypothetical protein